MFYCRLKILYYIVESISTNKFTGFIQKLSPCFGVKLLMHSPQVVFHHRIIRLGAELVHTLSATFGFEPSGSTQLGRGGRVSYVSC